MLMFSSNREGEGWAHTSRHPLLAVAFDLPVLPYRSMTHALTRQI